MRGTLHFVASADVRWILRLLAPRVIAGSAYRRRQLEIDDHTLARSRDLMGDALSGGRLRARDEAMNLLEGAGIKTTWSGLTVADAKAGIERARTRLARENVGDAVYWMSVKSTTSPQVARAVCLLPGFDEYVLGYADRGIAMDAVASQRINPGGNGVFRPTIVVDGHVVGTWRLGNKTRVSSVADLFFSLDAGATDALNKALHDYDGFVGVSPATA